VLPGEVSNGLVVNARGAERTFVAGSLDTE
jgi:hypothetical protein